MQYNTGEDDERDIAKKMKEQRRRYVDMFG